jgi:predicted DNA-binding transcriptional regulator AlpA
MSERVGLTGKDLGLTAVRGRLLTIKEIAGLTRAIERWVQSHMNDGTFPVRWYLISGHNRVVDSVDLDEWLRETIVAAGTAPLPPRAVKKLLEKEVSA